jgi:hypothetical protein
MLHPYVKGQSGNLHGRPKGAVNKTTREIKAIATRLVEDPEYMKSLRERLIAGTAGPLEPVLFYYAYGKPIDRIAPVNVDGSSYAPGQDSEELIALIADIRILLGRTEENDPNGGGLPH